jgi:hypothetical protein
MALATSVRIARDIGVLTWPKLSALDCNIISIGSIGYQDRLFETLIDRVKDTTEKLRARNEQAKEMVAAIKAAAEEVAASSEEK